MTYLLLVLTVLLSAFPIYWMFVIATSTDASWPTCRRADARRPAHQEPAEVFTTRLLRKSLVNSVIVSTVVTVSVLFFCSVAGFAFAKLRFRGSRMLMVMVILTLPCSSASSRSTS